MCKDNNCENSVIGEKLLALIENDKKQGTSRPRPEPKCFICEDKGLIEYTKLVDNLAYRFYTHCTCEKGLTFSYEGQRCKDKSDYRIPSIDEILPNDFIEEIKSENKKKYTPKTRGYRIQANKAEVKQQNMFA